MSKDNRERAIQYLRCLEIGDFSGARSMCSRTATVWHNDGKGEQTIDENIGHMQRQMPTIESMRYEVVRQIADPDSLLQQHVVHVVTKSGMRGEVHAAVYFRFEDELITRIEEYANFVPSDHDTNGN